MTALRGGGKHSPEIQEGLKAEVKCIELLIEPGKARGTISEINILIHMPQTHCFPQQRDLRPSTFYARAKDLGQNQSFKDFLLKKLKDSLASSQMWSDLFAFPLGTHRQARNWLATTVRVTHSPVGLFSLGFTRWGRRARGTLSLQRPSLAAESYCSSLQGKEAYNLPSLQRSVLLVHK